MSDGQRVWEAIEGRRRFTAHVHPLADLVEHDIDSEGDCACGPAVELVARDDYGGFGWIYVHAALDKRELSERAAAGGELR